MTKKAIESSNVKQDACPASKTNIYFNSFGVIGFFATLIIMREYFPFMDRLYISMTAFMMAFLPIFYCELKFSKIHKSESTGLVSKSQGIDSGRVYTKYMGLLATFGFIGFLYWLFPEYNTSYYDRYYSFLWYLVPAILIGGLIYVAEIDSRMKEPKDGYYMMGCIVTGRFKEIDWILVKEHLRGWVIKGFFLPLMFTYFMNNVNYLMTLDLSKFSATGIQNNYFEFYHAMFRVIMSIDILYASFGYIMTFRGIDTHIRSAEPTMFGWAVCILCYQPFWGLVFQDQYLGAYGNGYDWTNWLSGNMVIAYIWGAIILGLTFIFAFATVAMGIRFSNMTYRGLVTCGPYRYSKHPAYFAKCITWWFVYIPFIPYNETIWDTLQHCLLLSSISFVYYLRARTEENHLSNYPEYVEYANWMNEHGKLRFITRYLPYFAYNEDRAKSSGSVIWRKQREYKELVRKLQG